MSEKVLFFPSASASASEAARGVAPPKAATLKLEGVTTCVGNADFLAATLPLNLRHFDTLIVVTAPEDKETQRVCDFHGVKYYATDEFQSRWGHFCKGKGINHGLAQLAKDAWLLHIDADIALQPNLRDVLARADLDRSMIYGCDRAEFKSYEQWRRFCDAPEPHTQGNGFFIHIGHTGQALGTRVSFAHAGGYVPIGFFQLWHAESGIDRYQEGHTDAGREDSHFAAQWPRAKRGFLPEVVCYHLESEAAEMAVNWKGRQTKRFGVDGA
jgi:hypothetical protein